MNIQINRINNILNIAVLGDIYKKTDIAKLFNEIENIAHEKPVITFFDAKVLPQEIIEQFLKLKSIGNEYKLQVVHGSLSSYLFRLGIEHILLPNKSIQDKTDKKIRAIGIGGSAGSLERIISIVEALPRADIAIFIVQHILEKSNNYLASILKNYTVYQVKEAENNEKINTGYIYIAPPGHHMKVINRRIVLTVESPAYFARPSIDVLFESLTLEYKSSLVAILLSGYNDDGSHSLELLRQQKSTVLIQDPEECLEKELLINAIKTKNYNYIFPLPELIHYLKRHLVDAKEVVLDNHRIKEFLEDILTKYGYDYREYQYESISRLIIKEMSEQGIETFEQFKEQVLNFSESFEALFLEFSINVTEFFRDSAVFSKIRDNVFNYLASFPHIKIWCAGCSTGEEPYSLAIILKEEGLLQKSQIYATDINPFIIEQAKNGFFSETNIEKNIKNYHESGGKADLKDYFDKIDNCLQVKEEIRDKILFFQHSLVNQGVLNEFNLILCRNVIIYFDGNLQEKTMKLFSNSLSNNGFLILGSSEYVKNTDLFSFYDKNMKILKKSIKASI